MITFVGSWGRRVSVLVARCLLWESRCRRPVRKDFTDRECMSTACRRSWRRDETQARGDCRWTAPLFEQQLCVFHDQFGSWPIVAEGIDLTFTAKVKPLMIAERGTVGRIGRSRGRQTTGTERRGRRRWRRGHWWRCLGLRRWTRSWWRRGWSRRLNDHRRWEFDGGHSTSIFCGNRSRRGRALRSTWRRRWRRTVTWLGRANTTMRIAR